MLVLSSSSVAVFRIVNYHQIFHVVASQRGTLRDSYEELTDS